MQPSSRIFTDGDTELQDLSHDAFGASRLFANSGRDENRDSLRHEQFLRQEDMRKRNNLELEEDCESVRVPASCYYL